MKRYFSIIVTAILCLTLFAGCAKAKNEATESKGESYSTTDSSSMNKDAALGSTSNGYQDENTKSTSQESTAESASESQRKVIQSASINVETKEFDKTVKFINDTTEKEKGYIESSEIIGANSTDDGYVASREGRFTIRIPQERLKAFIEEADSYGVITSKKVTGQDITSQYFDTEARLKTLKIQEDRLLLLLTKSDKIEDIIELEKRLSEIRYEIENLTGTIRKWDNLVQLATIDIYVREVQKVTELKTKPVSFGSKVVDSFKGSIQALYSVVKGFIIVMVAIFPFAAVVAVIYVPVYIAVRNYKKKKGSGKADSDKDK